MLSDVSLDLIQYTRPNKRRAPLTKHIFKLLSYYHNMCVPLHGSFARVRNITVLDDGISCDEIIAESKTMKYVYNYEGVVHAKPIRIHVYTKTKCDCSPHARKIVLLMLFLLPFSNLLCSSTIEINLVLCDAKKKLPKRGEVIGPKHLNSGYCFRCMPGTGITVYRKEEWLKVLIHESFHYLGLDSSLEKPEYNAAVKRMFRVQSDINLPEAYCETWARMLNVYISAFYLNPANYGSTVSELLEIEKYYSWHQMMKILKFMGMTYEDLFVRNNKFKEKTNVFAYIILTNQLMQRSHEFVEWCAQHNPTLLRCGETFCFQLLLANRVLPGPISPSLLVNTNTRMSIVELE